jgi:hypothetical protein
MRKAASMAAPTADPTAAPATTPTEVFGAVEIGAAVIDELMEAAEDDGEIVAEAVDPIEVEVGMVVER